MRDYTNLFSDILFYTKEYERLGEEIKKATPEKKPHLERERERVKAKLDALTERVPEISET